MRFWFGYLYIKFEEVGSEEAAQRVRDGWNSDENVDVLLFMACVAVDCMFLFARARSRYFDVSFGTCHVSHIAHFITRNSNMIVEDKCGLRVGGDCVK